MDVDKLAIDLLLKGMTQEQQKAALESIKDSVTQAKAIQKQRIGENVQVVIQALKKIESNIKDKYDGVTAVIEKRVASIKDGKDGRNGADGKAGKDGRPGRDGAVGPRGADGLNGRDGKDGENGVSVTDAYIDFDGSLIIRLSSGQTLNVGEVVAPDIAEKIKVITNGGGTSQGVLDTLASLQAQINALQGYGTVDYIGTWNASTNSPSIVSGTGTKGYYYVVSVAGSTSIDGQTLWGVGDWIIFNGTVWQKVDGGSTGDLTTLTVTGNTTLGDASTDTVRVNGYMGVGGAPSASTALTVASTALTSTQQFGVSGQITGTSAATSLVVGVDAYPQTANASFTTTNVAGFYARAGLKGASNTASNWHGLYIADQTQGTNNYGITSLVSSGTNKWNIYASGTAANYFAGNLGIGTSDPQARLVSAGSSATNFKSLILRNGDGTTGSSVSIDFETSSGTQGLEASMAGRIAGVRVGSGTTGALDFFTTNGGTLGVAKMRIDAAGNLGLGVTPSAWRATRPAMQINSSMALWTGAGSASFAAVGANIFDDTLEKYINTGFATKYTQQNGVHAWFNAPSGTAGTAITFTQAMALTAAGDLGVGTTAPGSKLDVKGTLRLSGATSGYVGLAPAAAAGSTTYTLPAADGTSGQVLSTNGTATLSWATTSGGFKNRVINGDFSVAQRATSATITAGSTIAAGYATVDRFYAYCTGANVTAAQIAGSGSSQYRFQITGAASVTAVGVGQRIEQANCYDLAGSTCTLSVDLANSLLTTVTWTAYYANTADTFGTLASPTRTQIATGNFTVTSTVTNYQAQISVPGAATTGIEIVFTVGAQTSGTWTIGNVQFEAGDLKTSFERVDAASNLARCQRYFEQYGPDATNRISIGPAFSDGTTTILGMFQYMVIKRVNPTASYGGIAAPLRYLRNGTDITSGSTTITQISKSGASTGITGQTGLTAGDAGYLALEPNGTLQISAEL